MLNHEEEIEICEECGKAEATTHPIVYEEWGPVPMCEECASHYDEDECEVLYMDAEQPADSDSDWDDDDEHYLLDDDLLEDDDDDDDDE